MDYYRNDNPMKNGSINLGDGTAVNHLNSDSHDTNNSHNTINSNNSNVTNVYYGKSADEQSLAERKIQYRDFCRQVIRDGIISRQERKHLDDLAIKLSLEDAVKRSIEEDILKDASTTDMLTPADQMMLDMAIKQMEKNNPNVKDQLPKLEALAEKVEQDEAQFYYYLLLAIEAPSVLAKRYESKTYVNYWQSFWAYMAYTRLGSSKKAMEALNELQKLDGPEDNVMILQCAGWLYDYFVRDSGHEYLEYAQEGLKRSAISFLLNPLQTALNYLVQGNRPAMLSNSPECNFYLRLFEVRDNKHIAPKTVSVTPQPVAVPKSIPETPTREKETTISPTVNSGGLNRPSGVGTNPTYRNKRELSNSKWVAIASIIVCLGIGYFGWNALWGDKEQPVATPVAEQVSAVEEQATEATMPTTNNTKKTVTQTATTAASTTKTATNTNNGTTTSKPAAVTTTTKTETSTPKASSSQQSSSVVAETKASTIAPATSNTESTTTAKAATELSADELIRKGTSALRRFDDKAALSYFQQAVDKGSIVAHRYIGELYNNGGNNIKVSYPTAFEHYAKAANAGDAEAQYQLGMMYRSGHGTTKNLATAKSWLQKAAANGHADAAKALKKM